MLKQHKPSKSKSSQPQAPPRIQKVELELRGGCGQLFKCQEHEVILCGPSDTGKSFAGCLKAHLLCNGTPKAQGAIVRKTFNSLAGTVIKTFQRISEGDGVRAFGGEIPSRFIYPNGSCIWLGGMDNPDRALSSERDFIYVVQAEELSEADWEVLATRCSGRAAVVAHPQIFGDCNPSGSRHWIRSRKSLRLLTSTHKDNPTIYDGAGELTEDGKRRIAVLETLTGVRRKRLLEGQWATAEGSVYDMFSTAVHVRTRRRDEFKRFYLTLDEGYTNPAVVLVVGEDGDGRWHVFREFYQRGVLQVFVVNLTREWSLEFAVCDVVVDEAAAGLIADLQDAGLNAVGAKGRVLDGIQSVQNRLKVAGDGRPRLTVDPACVETVNELESYKWKPEKDVPEKECDHCFAGDTLILTKSGWKRIDTIRVGEHVLSPFGWNKVWKSGSTGVLGVVDYGAFRATPDHKILTQRGLVGLDALRYLDYVWVWQQERRWSLTEFVTGVMLSPGSALTGFISGALLQKSLEAARDICTGMYGNLLMGRFHLVRKCITRTAMLRIIALGIWSWLLISSTLLGIIGGGGKVLKNIFGTFGLLRPSGTDQGLGSNGTANTVEMLGTTGFQQNSGVKSAATNTRHSFLREAGFAGLTVRCGHCASEGIQSLDPTGRTANAIPAQTFNLSTEWGCYFAGGVLVSNSMDALRYLAAHLGEPTGAFSSASQMRTASVGDFGGERFEVERVDFGA